MRSRKAVFMLLRRCFHSQMTTGEPVVDIMLTFGLTKCVGGATMCQSLSQHDDWFHWLCRSN